MSFNKIAIYGFLGRDPELRYTPQGTAVCKLSIATTEKRQDKEYTTWFRVSAWGRHAELCNEYLSKGAPVYVEGRLRQEEYTDRDGNKRTNLEVNATDIQFMGSRNGSGESANEKPAQTAGSSQAKRAALQTPVDENDIPF